MNDIERELQRELTKALGAAPVTESSSQAYFALLQTRFPTLGSKIDWGRVPGALTERVDVLDPAAYRRAGATFFEKIRADHDLLDDLDVVVVGDSAVEMAVHVPVRLMRTCLSLFLDLPQHTYLLPRDGAWCASFTMEGDLCFGLAVRRALGRHADTTSE